MTPNAATTRLSPRQRLFYTRILPGIFGVAGVFCLVIGTRNVLSAKRSSAWPAASGVIRQSAVVRHSGTHGKSTYNAKVIYDFTVHGKKYSGSTVAFGDYGSSGSGHARGIVAKYPEGKTVTVHYRPDAPATCVLEPGIHAQAYLLPGAGVFALVLATVMVIKADKARIVRR